MIEEIIKLYYEPIFVYCRAALNGSKTAAEDVTQEVFLALYKKENRLKLGVNIKLWLYRAADIEIKAYIRKNPSFVPIDEIPEDDLLTEESFPSVSDSDFDCLSEEEKSLLYDYYSGEERKDVAKKHNIKFGSLYMRIYRIKQKLAVSAGECHKLSE